MIYLFYPDPKPDPVAGDLLSAAGIDGSFENTSSLQWANFGAYWGAPYDNSNKPEFSNAQAHSGSKSTYFDVPAGGGCAAGIRLAEGNLQIPLAVSTGKTYEIKFWAYIASNSASADASPAITFDFDGNTKPLTYPGVWVDTNFKTGEWVEHSVKVTAGSGVCNELQFRLVNSDCTSAFQVYIDDITCTEVGGGSTGGGSGSTGAELLAQAGIDGKFENVGNVQWANFGAYWGAPYDNSNKPVFSTDQAHSGSKSAYFDVPAAGCCAAGIRLAEGNLQIPLAVSSGKTYEVKFWIYIKSNSASADAGPAITFDFDGNNQPLVYPGVWIGADYKTGEWIECSTKVTSTSGVCNELQFRLVNADMTSAFQVYIDDITCTEVGGGSTGGGSTPSGEDMLSKVSIDGSFENTSATHWTNCGSGWGGIYVNSDDPVITSDQKHGGNNSTYFHVYAGGGSIAGMRTAAGDLQIAVPLVSGKKYRVKLWAYVEEMGVNGEKAPGITFGMAGAGASQTYPGVWFGDDTKRNEWTEWTVDFTAVSSVCNEFQFRVVNEGIETPFKVYIDDVTLVAL